MSHLPTPPCWSFPGYQSQIHSSSVAIVSRFCFGKGSVLRFQTAITYSAEVQPGLMSVRACPTGTPAGMCLCERPGDFPTFEPCLSVCPFSFDKD